MPEPATRADAFQKRFQQRWHGLRDPHVRALAWLLDSPELLEPAAPVWQGKIASFAAPANWLLELDREPDALHAALQIQSFTRLGRYAEKLMAFYFQQHGLLAAHGVQVRAGRNETIGEFDFLLHRDNGLLHLELATKFYLLEPSGTGLEEDYFVGPNLVDTLGAKMRKIFDQQLKLSSHPAALEHLAQPVAAAQALIKGWLFYHDSAPHPVEAIGVSSGHCRGFWCEMSRIDNLAFEHAVILTRLSWLAPAQTAMDDVLDRAHLTARLADHFRQDRMPVLVAIMERESENSAVETARGFIVPDDWQSRAAHRVRRPSLG